jgi:hypothetical protein
MAECVARALTVEDQVDGGRTGIRTQERVAPLTVFKTVAFVRSATLPTAIYPRSDTRAGAPTEVAAKLRPRGARGVVLRHCY